MGEKPGESLFVRAKEREFKKESVIREGKGVRTEDVPRTWQQGRHVGSGANAHSATKSWSPLQGSLPKGANPGMGKLGGPFTLKLLHTEK